MSSSRCSKPAATSLGRAIRAIDERWTWLDGTTRAVASDGKLLIDTSHYTRMQRARSSQPRGADQARPTRQRRSPAAIVRGASSVLDGRTHRGCDGDVLVLDQVEGGLATDDGVTFATNGATDVVLSKRTAKAIDRSGDTARAAGLGLGRRDRRRSAIWVGSASSTIDAGTRDGRARGSRRSGQSAIRPTPRRQTLSSRRERRAIYAITCVIDEAATRVGDDWQPLRTDEPRGFQNGNTSMTST